MDDWYGSLGNEVNPESGLVEGQYSSTGRAEAPGEGSGEGYFSMLQGKKKTYEKIGQALQQQSGGMLISGGLNQGFDQNWLAENSTLGSAMGQKI